MFYRATSMNVVQQGRIDGEVLNKDAVGVGCGDVAQLFKVRSYELRPAFANDTEHLRCPHPHTFIAVVQQLGKQGHVIL